MVHCLMTDKENYCALRPQSYELHTVEGVFIPYCISFLLRLIVHSAPHRMGSTRWRAFFYPLLYKFFIEAYCALRPPSCEDSNILALSIAACEILLPLSIFAISSTRSSILRSVIVLVVPSAVSSFNTL